MTPQQLEQLALELYPVRLESFEDEYGCGDEDTNESERIAFVAGYQKAMESNEALLYKCYSDCLRKFSDVPVALYYIKFQQWLQQQKGNDSQLLP